MTPHFQHASGVRSDTIQIRCVASARGGIMFKRIIFSTIAMALICGLSGNLARADDQAAAVEQVKQAKQAADAWLKLVDDGNYKESWNQFASVVKPLVTEDKWE